MGTETVDRIDWELREKSQRLERAKAANSLILADQLEHDIDRLLDARAEALQVEA
jgi:hypothetical protein